MNKGIYQNMTKQKLLNKKSFAVLVDPDKMDAESLTRLIELSEEAKVDYIFVGGSLVVSDYLESCVETIKANSDLPVILFPGSPSQLSRKADALLYLSLISGRNPELLIGQHVISAPFVKQSGLEVMSTGYMVVDGGAPTTVSYISNASPLPSDKSDIAMCTAMAGEMLGMKLIYMDAGSGAKRPVSAELIKRVSKSINVPLIVGGGIVSPEQAFLSSNAGADIIVVGNAIEKDRSLISEISSAVHAAGTEKV
jgi:putative glycerol-1-phosphate prenyltransferase